MVPELYCLYCRSSRIDNGRGTFGRDQDADTKRKLRDKGLWLDSRSGPTQTRRPHRFL
jgi:hypothetical protein